MRYGNVGMSIVKTPIFFSQCGEKELDAFNVSKKHNYFKPLETLYKGDICNINRNRQCFLASTRKNNNVYLRNLSKYSDMVFPQTYMDTDEKRFKLLLNTRCKDLTHLYWTGFGSKTNPETTSSCVNSDMKNNNSAMLLEENLNSTGKLKDFKSFKIFPPNNDQEKDFFSDNDCKDFQGSSDKNLIKDRIKDPSKVTSTDTSHETSIKSCFDLKSINKLKMANMNVFKNFNETGGIRKCTSTKGNNRISLPKVKALTKKGKLNKKISLMKCKSNIGSYLKDKLKNTFSERFTENDFTFSLNRVMSFDGTIRAKVNNLRTYENRYKLQQLRRNPCVQTPKEFRNNLFDYSSLASTKKIEEFRKWKEMYNFSKFRMDGKFNYDSS